MGDMWVAYMSSITWTAKAEVTGFVMDEWGLITCRGKDFSLC
jgi:hypothetical protein